MKQFVFFKFLLVLIVFFFFVRIYQHNRYMRINYEAQRIEKNKNVIVREYDQLQIQLAEKTNYAKIKSLALDSWGMTPLQAEKIISVD